MDPTVTLRLIEAIEKLKLEVVKKSNQGQMDAVVALRLTEAVKELNEELNEESHFDKKSFIEVSKPYTLCIGVFLNASNALAVNLFYNSKHMMLGNKGATDTALAGVPPIESASAPPRITLSFLILGAMFCFLFTSCVVSVAHAAVQRREWFSKLVVMMILEIPLLYASVMLHAYLLTGGHPIIKIL